MNRNKFCRRTFLSGLGLGGAFLPLLHANRARAATFPKRMVAMMWCNGVLKASFWPTNVTSETQFTLNTVMKPLEPWKSKLLILGGIDHQIQADDNKTLGSLGHNQMYCVLTGTRGVHGLIYGNQDFPIANSASVDQFVANSLEAKGVKTPIKTLELGVYPGENTNDALSYRGPAIGPDPHKPQANPPEYDPAKVFSRLFGGGQIGTAGPTVDVALARLRAERRSILDNVGRDLETFAARLGVDDRNKVQSHLDSIRQIEKDLSAPPPSAPAISCTAPTAPGALDAKSMANYQKVMQLQLDLTAAALACNITNVVTFMMSDRQDNNLVLPWLGPEFKSSHHGVSHDAGTLAEPTRQKNIMDTWFVSQYAYLLKKLSDVQEGDGTMLDNSVVYLTNNMNDGGEHGYKGVAAILAGGCGGYFRTGRYIRYGNIPHNGILTALCNAMGVPTKSFGDPAYGGEIPNVT